MTILRRTDTSASSPVAAATPFAILRSDLDRRTVVISVEGELDLSTAPRLKWTLIDALEASRSQIVLDLSQTTFMDSTALGVLLGLSRRPELARIAIVCTREDVLRIFEFSGVEDALPLFREQEEAIAHVRGRAAPDAGADGAAYGI